MRIGYACKTIGVPNSDFRSCILKNATPETLTFIIDNNLKSLDHIINYNIEMGILLFRISSDLIPFASNPVNRLDWSNIFKNELVEIGRKIKAAKIRVSMHPGQYTVINSPNSEVVKRSISDLEYHCHVLDSMELAKEHKLILHIGGIYQDKKMAMLRFQENYKGLADKIKDRLIIENDDKLYNIEDVLRIGNHLNCPVVFDSLHHEINPPQLKKSDIYWIDECSKTWKEEDGHQKIHYSQQNESKKRGSHSTTISLQRFLPYYQEIARNDLDIMLEVKDKNLSAIKCINGTKQNKTIHHLEQEWSRYKYTILDRDPAIYEAIRGLLKDKKAYPVEAFYRMVDEALKKEQTLGHSLNAVLHVWGYFKNIITEKEKKDFLKYIDQFEQGTLSLLAIKRKLCRLAQKYDQQYLIHSYYFDLH